MSRRPIVLTGVGLVSPRTSRIFPAPEKTFAEMPLPAYPPLNLQVHCDPLRTASHPKPWGRGEFFLWLCHGMYLFCISNMMKI